MRTHAPRCSVAVVALSLSLVGCGGVRHINTPKGIAETGLKILAGVETVQTSIIAAEKSGVISEHAAATALIQIRTIVIHARQLSPALRALDEAKDEARAKQMHRARAIVYTVSQLMAALTLPGDVGVRAAELLQQVNELLLRLSAYK